MTTKVPYEDVQAAATDIAQCAMNALTVSDLSEQSGVISMLQGVNGALQQRFVTLDLDTTRANQLPDDYDTDVESAWANPSEIVTVHNDCHFSSCSDLFADGDDFSWQTIRRGRNQYYQRQLANQIEITTTRTLSLLTNALKIHLNVGQNMTINTSSIFMSLERLTIPALLRKTTHQPESGRIQLPPSIRVGSSNYTSILLRVRLLPVLPFSLMSVGVSVVDPATSGFKGDLSICDQYQSLANRGTVRARCRRQ